MTSDELIAGKTTMLQRSRTLLALLLLSCSSSVDLSGAPPPPKFTASTDPAVLGVIDEQVGEIRVDDERLYWIGTKVTSGVGDVWALRSCNKAHCSDSLLTYDSRMVPGFGLANGEIYWVDLGDAVASRAQLRGCSVEGCTQKSETIPLPYGVQPLPALDAVSSDAFFSCDQSGQLWRLSLSGTAPSSVILATKGRCGSPVIFGDYVYAFVTSAANSSVITSSIQRIQSDGSGAVETLATDLEIALDPSGAYLPDILAVDGSYVYWGQGTLAGSVARCPIAGCNGAPEIVAEPVRSPATLLLDETQIYWLQGTASRGLALASCAPEHCIQTEPLSFGIDSTSALALDDRYLYTATSDQVLNPDVDWTNPSAQIRRIPK